MSKWQDKTRGGWPVENVRPIDNGIWQWVGQVTYSCGRKGTLTWTKEGYHTSDQKPVVVDLVPLESPVEAPAESDARKALAEAARAYKRAKDALDATVLANLLASTAFGDAVRAFGPDLAFVVDVDGETFVVGRDGEFSPVEVI